MHQSTRALNEKFPGPNRAPRRFGPRAEKLSDSDRLRRALSTENEWISQVLARITRVLLGSLATVAAALPPSALTEGN